MNGYREDGLECVDPRVGERILELRASAEPLTAADRELLEAHAEVCAYCALLLDLDRGLDEGFRDGSLRAADSKVVSFPWWRRLTGWSALASAAACLVCLVLLPPLPVGPRYAQRGEGGAVLIRPVEGEVVPAQRWQIIWNAVPEADSYRIDLAGVDGDASWRVETGDTRMAVPDEAGLRRGSRYRILLSTVPADLLAPGAASVTIRVGSWADVAAHRIRQASRSARLLALAALVFAAAFVLSGRFSRVHGMRIDS